ncbi:MAG: glycoside hydrolase family 2 TIM barrel-domain containing protein [Flavobacteriaceae bacterium]|nr:glycoside hydrolase family 2 TIM barrel-domain containing protein [Flavobacteriaceae bacterium]
MNKKSFLLFFILLSVFSFSQERENQISLNGEWEIIYDQNNDGRNIKLHTIEGFKKSQSEKINVPSGWEEYKKDYEGVAYYKKTFKISSDLKKNTIFLNFDAVNYLSEVYLNDNALGYHEGGFSPFKFNIEHILNYDSTNTLILRVVGPITIQEKVIDGMGQMETPQWRGSYTGGIWQNVYLESTGKIIIEDLFIKPDIYKKQSEIDFKIVNKYTQEKNTILINKIFNNKGVEINKQETKILLQPGINKISQIIRLNEISLWSPNNPSLYKIKSYIKIKDKTEDIVFENFGFREFTVKDDRFYLNDKPIYLKAAFFEGLYPIKLAHPDSKEMVIKEIMMAKKAGFNMIRPWRKPPPPMWLKIADSLGVLTVGSMAIECMDMPIETPYLPRRVENEITESILRDRNHVSIVQWELFNEIRRPVLANMLKPMALKARKLDPTRMILDESGGWAEGANLFLPYNNTPIKFNDIHNYPGPNINKDIFDGFLTIGNTKEENKQKKLFAKTPGRNVLPNLPSYVSEIGYGSLPNLEENELRFREKGNPITYPYLYHINYNKEIKKALKETGLNKIFNKTEDFYKLQQKVHGIANKRMIEAIRSNPNVIGYCVHALTAGDWVIGAGLLDLWRNPKGDAYYKTKEANQENLLVIRTNKRNYYKNEKIDLEFIGINERQNINVNVNIIIKKGNKIIYRKSNKTPLKLKNGVSNLYDFSIEDQYKSGEYIIYGQIRDINNNFIASSERKFNVFDQLKSNSKLELAIINNNPKIINYLNENNIRYQKFNRDTQINIPVLIFDNKISEVSSNDGNIVSVNSKTDTNFHETIEAVNEFVYSGGSAIFLNTPARMIKRSGENLTFQVEGRKLLPMDPIKNMSKGLWDGILHINKKHPIFKGLPVNIPLTDLYENVGPTVSFRGLKGNNIVQTIAFDRIPNGNIMKRNYIGSGDVWIGSDLSIIKHNQGKMLLSTLKVFENLGKDPVADKILFNMISYFQ